MRMRTRWVARGCALSVAATLALAPAADAQAPTDPEVLDPALAVSAAVSELNQPISIAFLGKDDMLVLEKASGQVKRVVRGQVRDVVLDLAVNSASERGLLGIALHPKFRRNGWVYLFWSQSASGVDSTDLADVRLMANRVDRFEWDDGQLEFDRNIITFRAFQNDATNGVLRGNHNGGVIRFGPDGKLYAIVGDTGRRGQTQNLATGPFTPPADDDQFGGPEPDDAHLTGVILRLNDDGTTPTDNPFYDYGATLDGEVGANIQKIFAYGIRNGFGMDFDPASGDLWEQENGDDTFDEINRVERGMNGGWVQLAGPIDRVAQFREMESTFGGRSLQQLRWPPTNIAETPEEARDRIQRTMPMAHFSDPEFSWKWAVPPGGIGFVDGDGLGEDFAGDLFVGGATQGTLGGHLFRFKLDKHRRNFALDDPRLADRVADNNAKADMTESESLLAGRSFGVLTDIQTGPDGHLYAVSTNRGIIYEIFPR